MTTPETLQLTDYLGQYLTDNRKANIEKVLEQRTRYITVVLEDIYQSQNASAVVRTCECMGLQDLHIIETTAKYGTNKKVLMGANKWMDLIRYRDKEKSNIAECYMKLKAQGYKLVATAPDATLSIDELPIDNKVAFVMGNELRGVTKFALDNADEVVQIPMFGFTESMNISVSAALCIRSLVTRVRNSEHDWRLDQDEKANLRLDWYRKCLKKPGIMEAEFLSKVRDKR
jgi:tRNA (guanosine-2'-O-)-methyltransferase